MLDDTGSSGLRRTRVHFEGDAYAVSIVEKLPERTHGNAVSIVTVCKNALYIDGIANNFPAKNALDCRILYTVYSVSQFFRGDPRRSALVLGPRHQFPLGLLAASYLLTEL